MKINLSERIYETDRRIYTIEDDKFISVTSLLSMVHVESPLDNWKEEMIEKLGIRGYREYMNETADVGTVVHGLIETTLEKLNNGEDASDFYFDYQTPISEYNFKAKEARKRFSDKVPYRSWKLFKNWLGWFEQSGIESTEFIEEKLVSKTYKYAGTSDALVTRKDHGLVLQDWKSSGYAASDKHKLQAAMYAHALQEQHHRSVDAVSIVCCGMSTIKGWHETMLWRRVEDVVYKPTKKMTDEEVNNRREQQTIGYWFDLAKHYIAIAQPAIDKVMSNEKSLPRYLFIPSTSPEPLDL